MTRKGVVSRPRAASKPRAEKRYRVEIERAGQPIGHTSMKGRFATRAAAQAKATRLRRELKDMIPLSMWRVYVSSEPK